MLQPEPEQDFNSLFDKKHIEQKTYSIDKLGPWFFSIFLILGVYFSIPEKFEKNTSAYPHVSTINNHLENHSKYTPDLIAPSILNYKTTQTINNSSYKDYLNQPEQVIDFSSFSNENLNYQLNATDIMNGINYIKHLMIQEDLSIVPFSKGEVTIESEIIETTQSQHFYMVEVLKTFTQGKKVVKVLERKVFDLQDFEIGLIHYQKNIMHTSQQLDK